MLETNQVKYGFFGKLMKKLIEFLSTVPSTNARIIFSFFLWGSTAIKYYSSDTWVPDGTWLMSLCALSGIDALQYISKRATHITPDGETVSQKIRSQAISSMRSSTAVPAAPAEEAPATDVQDLYNSQKG